MPMHSPIADLSYRSYDGPLDSPNKRWWIIARMTLLMGFKRKGFWWVALPSAFYYFIMMIFLYFIGTIGEADPEREQQILGSLNWTNQFYHGTSMAILFFFILTLLIGAGSIANDNRANALLVYLSKPCRKIDYVIGKWVGIVSVLFVVAIVPMILFYGYGAMSYREYGFVSKDPWLFFKLIPLALIPAIVNGSFIVGVSSLFNQGRIAGAVYAALYFVSGFMMQIVGAVRAFEKNTPPILDNISYLSVGGIQDGLMKILLNTDGGLPFLIQTGRRGAQDFILPIPSAGFLIPISLIVCAASIWLAWSRVRAVEVVQ